MLEQMDEFFTKRVDLYDEHMIKEVPGCQVGYQKMASLVPATTKQLLDLGCGTGLELEEIFRLYPDIQVVGIDMTKAMLDKLAEKFPQKKMTLIHQSYLEYDFGKSNYDTAISFQTMHHLEAPVKKQLYSKIRESLRQGGVYIECDYMVESQLEEDFLLSENERLRAEQNIPLNEFYHFDIPCTIDHQIQLFLQVGFIKAEMVFREENTTIIIAAK